MNIYLPTRKITNNRFEMKLYLMNLLDMSTGTAWNYSRAKGDILYIAQDEVSKYNLSNLDYIDEESLELIHSDKPGVLIVDDNGVYKINNHWHKRI